MTPTDTNMPRGIRNKNPGNIRHNDAFSWLHEIQPDEAGFCRFNDPIFGIRAAVLIFHHYQEYSNLTTIEEMIRRWAPPVENDSIDYARYVAGRCRTLPNASFDFLLDALEFCRAIVSYENGQDPYNQTTYNAAITLANTQR